jgi:uncharacterized membrane protein YqgA involved in biofilm formation
MSDGIALSLIVMAGLIFGQLLGVKKQLARIADFCERNEKGRG